MKYDATRMFLRAITRLGNRDRSIARMKRRRRPARADRFADVPSMQAIEALEDRTLLTDVSGTITTDTVWADTFESYRLVGDLTIQNGATLTIMSGVRVSQSNAAFDLFIQGGATVSAASAEFSTKVFVGSASSGGGTLNANLSTFNGDVEFLANGTGSLTNGTVRSPLFRVREGAMPTISGTWFARAFSEAMHVHAEFIPQLAGNTFGSNYTIGIYGSTVDQSTTWSTLTNVLPYRMLGSINVRGAGTNLTISPNVRVVGGSTVTVDGGATLTLNQATLEAHVVVGSEFDGAGTLNSTSSNIGGIGSGNQVEVIFRANGSGTFTDGQIRGRLTVDDGSSPSISGTFITGSLAVISRAEFIPLLANTFFSGGATLGITGDIDESITLTAFNGANRYQFLDGVVRGSGTTLTIDSGVTIVNSDLLIQDDATVIADGVFTESTHIWVGYFTNGTFHSDGGNFQGQITFHTTGSGTLTNGTMSQTLTVYKGSSPTVTGMLFDFTSPLIYAEFAASLVGANRFTRDTQIQLMGGVIDQETTLPSTADVIGYILDGDIYVRGNTTTLSIDPGVFISSRPSHVYFFTVDGGATAVADDVVWDRTVIFVGSEEDGGGTFYGDRGIYNHNVTFHANGSGQIHQGVFWGVLVLDGDSTLDLALNDLSNAFVNAVGNTSAVIDLRNQWWGTTSLAEIENRITHKVDLSSRPLVLFDPPLSAAPDADAPVAIEDDYTVQRRRTFNASDATGTVGGIEDDGVLVNDTDPNGDPLQAILIDGPTHATLFSLESDGTFVYRHNGDDTEYDSFTYRVFDGTNYSDIIRVEFSFIEPTYLVDVELVPVSAVSSSTQTSLPNDPIDSSNVGGTYYVEVWVRSLDAGNGVLGGSFDIEYPTQYANALSITIDDRFPNAQAGSVDDPAGLIDDLGGQTTVPNLGLSPAWVRLGYIEVLATARGQAAFTLAPGTVSIELETGTVNWDDVDLLDDATVDHQGSEWVDVSLSLVTTETTTDANGEAAALPADAAYVHEWESYWVEVWLDTPHINSRGIASASIDFSYAVGLATATAVEFGPAFTGTSSIDDATGQVQLDAATALTTVGDDAKVLVARVRFEPGASDQAEVDEAGRFVGPHSLALTLNDATVGLTSSSSAREFEGSIAQTDVYSVIYDIDDNDLIDFGDFAFFSPAFGGNEGDAEPPYIWWADFDKSGTVDFGDLALFASNFGKSKSAVAAGSESLTFAANYPTAWVNAAGLTLFSFAAPNAVTADVAPSESAAAKIVDEPVATPVSLPSEPKVEPVGAVEGVTESSSTSPRTVSVAKEKAAVPNLQEQQRRRRSDRRIADAEKNESRKEKSSSRERKSSRSSAPETALLDKVFTELPRNFDDDRPLKRRRR